MGFIQHNLLDDSADCRAREPTQNNNPPRDVISTKSVRLKS